MKQFTRNNLRVFAVFGGSKTLELSHLGATVSKSDLEKYCLKNAM